LLHPFPGKSPRCCGPSAAFTRDAFLCVGGVALELVRAGAENDGAVTVRLPGRKLLFSGSGQSGESRLSWRLDSTRRTRPRRTRRLASTPPRAPSDVLRGVTSDPRPILRLSK
jgi:hypothetical protein